MSIFSGLFKSRDKPENRTPGSSYAFYLGGSSSGKLVTERSAMQMTAVYACVRILSEAIAGLPLHMYRKVIYRCNRKYNGEKCQTPHVTEDEVKAAFISAYNQLVTEKKEIIANAEIIRKTLCVTDNLQEEKGKLEEEMAVLVEMTQNIVAENARVAQDQDEYQKRYDGLVKRYDEAKARYDEVVATISAKEAQSERLSDFIKVLKAQDGTISEFDGSLWGSMVEFVTVGRDKVITVTFRDGTEIQA